MIGEARVLRINSNGSAPRDLSDADLYNFY